MKKLCYVCLWLIALAIIPWFGQYGVYGDDGPGDDDSGGVQDQLSISQYTVTPIFSPNADTKSDTCTVEGVVDAKLVASLGNNSSDKNSSEKDYYIKVKTEFSINSVVVKALSSIYQVQPGSKQKTTAPVNPKKNKSDNNGNGNGNGNNNGNSGNGNNDSDDDQNHEQENANDDDEDNGSDNNDDSNEDSSEDGDEDSDDDDDSDDNGHFMSQPFSLIWNGLAENNTPAAEGAYTATTTANLIITTKNAKNVDDPKNIHRTSQPVTAQTILDLSGPVIAISPVNDSTINTNTPVITVAYSDNLSELNLSTLAIKIDNVDSTGLFTVGQDSAVYAVPETAKLSEGAHTISVTLLNSQSISSAAASTFTVETAQDTTPPDIAISPLNGVILSTGTPTVTVTYSEDASQIDLSSLAIFIDNINSTSLFAVTSSSATYAISPANALSEGGHTISASIANSSGLSSTVNSNFIVDLSGPAIAVSPVNGSTIGTETPVISISYSDNLSGVNTATLSVTIDGVDSTNLFTITGTGADYSVLASNILNEGSHTVQVSIANSTELASMAISTFTIDVIDTAIPQITNLSPALDSAVTNETPAVSATFSDNRNELVITNVAVFFNNTDVTSQCAITHQGFSYAPTVPLADGIYQVNITGLADIDGNTASAQWSFYVATAAATVLPNASSTITVTDTQSPIYGTTLSIPQDAVSQPVDISILEIILPVPPPAELIELSQAVDLQPDGMQFNVPVTVTLSYDEQKALDGWVSEEGLKIYALTSNTQEFQELSNSTVDITANTVSADITQINGLVLIIMGKPMTSFEITNYTTPLTAGFLSSLKLRAITSDSYTVEGFAGVVKITLTGVNDRWNAPYFTDIFYVTFTGTDNGIITADNIFTMVYSGNQTIKAEVVDYPEISGIANIEVIPSTPQSLSKLSGDNQYAGPNETLPEMFSVKVTDMFGNPIPQKNVAFEKRAGYGYFPAGTTFTAATNSEGISVSAQYKTANEVVEEKISSTFVDENVVPYVGNFSVITAHAGNSPIADIANPDVAFALDPETGVKLIVWEENVLLNPNTPGDKSISTQIYYMLTGPDNVIRPAATLANTSNTDGQHAFPCVTYDLQHKYFAVVYSNSNINYGVPGTSQYRVTANTINLSGDIIHSNYDVSSAMNDYPSIPVMAYDTNNSRHMIAYALPIVGGFALSSINVNDNGYISTLIADTQLCPYELFQTTPVRTIIPSITFNSGEYTVAFMAEEPSDNANIPELRKITPKYFKFNFSGVLSQQVQQVSDNFGCYVPPADADSIRRIDVVSDDYGVIAVWEDYSKDAFLNDPQTTGLPGNYQAVPDAKFKYFYAGGNSAQSSDGTVWPNGRYPRIAYDTVHKKYLVCCIDDTNNIFAQQFKINIDTTTPPPYAVTASFLSWNQLTYGGEYAKLGKLAYDAPEKKYVLVTPRTNQFGSNLDLMQTIVGMDIYNMLSAAFYVHPKTNMPAPAPVNLTSISTENGIALSWQMPEHDYTGINFDFKIFRSENNYNSLTPDLSYFQEVGTVANFTNWIDTTAEKFRKYYYFVKIRAYMPQGFIDSAPTNVTTNCRDYPVNTVPPAVPDTIIAVQDLSGIRLEIGTVAQTQDFAGYFIYRSTEENGIYEKVNAVPAVSSDNQHVVYFDSPVNASVSGLLYYKVTAADFFGNESIASSVQAIFFNPYFPPMSGETGPFPPSGITAYGLENSIAINWISNAESDIAYYNVYRTSGTVNKLVNIASTSKTHYVDKDVTSGRIYEYAIIAVNKSGFASNYSVTVETQNFASLPNPATPVIANAIPGDSSMALQWNLETQPFSAAYVPIDHYEVSYSPSSAGSINTESSILTFGSLENGTPYNFSVTAISIYGTSASTVTNWATPVEFVIPAPIITSPVNNSWLISPACTLNVTIDSSIDITEVNSMLFYVNDVLQETSPVTSLIMVLWTGSLQEGQNTISVLLEDRYGRRSAPAGITVFVDTMPPQAPQNLSAVQLETQNVDNTFVKLTWTPDNTDTSVAGYNIYRNGMKMNSSLIAQSEYLDPVDNSMHRQTFSYFMTAVDFVGQESPVSNTSPVTLIFRYDRIISPAPAIISPLDNSYTLLGGVHVSVMIDSSIDTSKVTLLHFYVNDVLTTTLSAATGQISAYIPLPQDGTYTIGVVLEDIYESRSEVSSVTVTGDTVIPQAPQNLSLVQLETLNVDDTFVKLTWTPDTADTTIAGYWIYRDNVQLNSSLITQAEYLDPISYAINNGQTLSYYVKAVDFAGNASYSDTKTITVVFVYNVLTTLTLENVPAGVMTGMPVSFSISARNKLGQVITDYAGTVKITHTGTVSPYQTYSYPSEMYFEFTPDMQGTGYLQNAILFYETGMQTITAQSMNTSVTANAQITVTAGPAEKLFKISGDNQQTYAKSPVAQNFVVKAADYYENGAGAGHDVFFYPNPTDGFFNGYEKNQKVIVSTTADSNAISPLYYAGTSSGIDSVKAVLPGVLESTSLNFNGVEFTYTLNSQTDNKYPKAGSAYNDIDNTYVFVWLENNLDTGVKGIKAQMYNSSGNPINEIVTIRESDNLYTVPNIVRNRTNNDYLIAWIESAGDTTNQVFGTIMQSDGTPLNGVFEINQISSGAGIQNKEIVLAYNIVRNEYFVVWQSYANDNYDLRGALVSVQGTVIPGYSNTAISAEASMELNPSLVFKQSAIAGDTNEYVIAYDEFSNNKWLPGIRRINPETLQTISYAQFNSQNNIKHPDIAYSRNAQRYILTYWQNSAALGSNISCAILDVNLSQLNQKDITSFSQNMPESYPKTAGGMTTVNGSNYLSYLMVWDDYRNDALGDIYYNVIDINGNLVGVNNVLAGGIGYQMMQEVKSNPVTQSFLAMWVDRKNAFDNGKINASILGTNYSDFALGKLETQTIAVAGNETYNVRPHIASANNTKYGGYAVVWTERDFVKQTRKTRLQITDSDGYPTGAPLLINESPATSPFRRPNIVFNEQDTTYLIVWIETTADGTQQVMGTIVNSQGLPVNGISYNVTQLSSGSGIQNATLNLVYNKQLNEYLVLWQTYYNGSYNIRATRVSAQAMSIGSVFSIASEINDEINPSIVYNSTENAYFVVYEEYYNNLWELSARKLDSAGTLLSYVQRFTSSNLRHEKHPNVAYNSTNNEYLVVFWRKENEANTQLRYNLFDASLNITTRLSFTDWIPVVTESTPELVYDNVQNRYLAVWDDYRTDANGDVYYQVIEADGTLTGQNTAVALAGTQEMQDVGFNEKAGNFLLCWIDTIIPNTYSTIKARTLGPDFVDVAFNVEVSTTTGRITLNYGTPGISVYVYQNGSNTGISSVTDLDGTVSFTLTAGQYDFVTEDNTTSAVVNPDTEITVTPDTIPPVLTISTNPNTPLLDTQTPQINVNYSDNASGINTATFKLFIDNNDVTANAVVGTLFASYVPSTPLSTGTHAVRTEIRDNSGNLSTASAEFTIYAISPSQTTLTTSHDVLIANNASQAVITVTPKNPAGNSLGAGYNVVISNTGPGVLSGVIDRLDGTYTAVITATLITGTDTITATVNGMPITQQTHVMFVLQGDVQTASIQSLYPYHFADDYTVRVSGTVVGGNSLSMYQWYLNENGTRIAGSELADIGSSMTQDFTFNKLTVEPFVYVFGFRKYLPGPIGHEQYPYSEVSLTMAPYCGGVPSEANSPFVVSPLSAVDYDASSMAVMDGIAFMPNSANVELGASELNLADGTLSIVQPVTVSRGAGFTANITFIYNSLSYNDGYNGYGWRHNLDMRVSQRGTDYVVVNETGLPVRFTLQSGVYRPEAKYGEPSTILTVNPNGTYTVVRKSGVTLQFNNLGRLVSINDTKGNTLALAYTGPLLTAVTDSAGRTTALNYAGNQIIEILMPGDAVTTLEYSGKYLTAVHLPTGEVIRYEYDATSKYLVKKTDPDGNVYEYFYGAWGKLSSVKYPDGSQTAISYSEGTNTVSITDAITGVHTYSYDALLNLITQYTDPLGNAIASNWDSSRNNTNYENPKSGNFTAEYWPNGSPKTVINAKGYLSYFEYNERNNMTKSVGPVKDLTNDGLINMDDINLAITDGDLDSYAYDVDNNRTSWTDRGGYLRLYSYDGLGRILVQNDPYGVETNFTYDVITGLAETITDSLGYVQRNEYNDQGFLSKYTDAEGYITKFDRDFEGRVTKKTGPVGDMNNDFVIDDTDVSIAETLGGYSITTVYTPNGDTQSVTDQMGKTASYEYNNWHKPLIITDANLNQTLFAYDSMGNLTQKTDANANSVFYHYNSAGRMDWSQDALGRFSYYTYDEFGNAKTVTDRNGNITSYTTDVLNMRTGVKNALDGITGFSYDEDGNMLTSTDVNGHSTVWTYDKINRVLTQTDHLGNTTSYEYSAPSDTHRWTKITDPRGSAATSHFDILNRLDRTEDAFGNYEYFSYDGNRNLTGFTDKNGHATAYTYERASRMKTKTDALGNTVTYLYDDAGNITGEINPRGFQTTYGYDDLHRRTDVTDALGNNSHSAYDAVGNLVSLTNPRGYSTVYSYNANYWMTNVQDALLQNTGYSYDNEGNVLTITDRNGKMTSFSYDSLNRMTAKTNALGKATAFSYDAVGNRTGVTDENNHQTTFTYNEINRLIEQSDAKGYKTSFGYDPAGNLVTQTDPMSNSMTYGYDFLNRRISITNALSYIATLSYDNAGNLTATTDPKMRTTTFAYNEINQLTSSTDPMGYVKSYGYDEAGNRTSFTDENNKTTGYGYDAINRMTQTTNALGKSRTFGYDQNGNLTTETDELNKTRTYAYDGLDRRTSVTDALNNSTVYGFDAEGNTVSMTDANNHTTYLTYNDIYKLTMETSPTGAQTGYGYDNAGNLTTLTDPNNNTTAFSYDEINRLTTKTDPMNRQTNFTYDYVGNLIILTDANLNAENYYYDELYRKIETVNAMSERIQFGYDEVGNLTSVTDANGNTTNFGYDNLNRRTSETDPLGKTTQYQYNPTGTLSNKTTPKGDVHTFTYDDINRLAASSHPGIGTYNYAYNDANYVTGITGPDTNVSYLYDDAYRTVRETNANLDYQLDYRYDNAGNLTNAASRRISTQAQVTNNGYGWDAADRLTTLTSDMTMTYFEYDSGSRRTKKTLSNGAYTAYSYDNANNLLQLGNYKSNSDLISRFTYNVDAVGNRTQMVIQEPDKTDTIDYAYDNAYRLTRETRVSTNSAMNYVEEFDYDAMGNRTQKRKSVQGNPFVDTDYSYNAVNQLANEATSGAQTDYSYDDNGNLVQKQSGVDITIYGFDSLDRMTSATVNGVTSLYSYDVSGKRIRKNLMQSGQGVMEYWHQGDNVIAETNPATQIISATYNTPFLDENISMNKNGQMYYYMQDGLGSVRNLVDSVQSVVNSYDYTAWGEAVSGQELVQNPYRYTGREWDNETNQYYYRSRYYNPAIGRFNQKDRIGFNGGYNLYAYVNNQPNNYRDSYGEKVIMRKDQAAFLAKILNSQSRAVEYGPNPADNIKIEDIDNENVAVTFADQYAYDRAMSQYTDYMSKRYKKSAPFTSTEALPAGIVSNPVMLKNLLDNIAADKESELEDVKTGSTESSNTLGEIFELIRDPDLATITKNDKMNYSDNMPGPDPASFLYPDTRWEHRNCSLFVKKVAERKRFLLYRVQTTDMHLGRPVGLNIQPVDVRITATVNDWEVICQGFHNGDVVDEITTLTKIQVIYSPTEEFGGSRRAQRLDLTMRFGINEFFISQEDYVNYRANLPSETEMRASQKTYIVRNNEAVAEKQVWFSFNRYERAWLTIINSVKVDIGDPEKMVPAGVEDELSVVSGYVQYLNVGNEEQFIESSK